MRIHDLLNMNYRPTEQNDRQAVKEQATDDARLQALKHTKDQASKNHRRAKLLARIKKAQQDLAALSTK